MNDIARLGIEVESSSVGKAVVDLDKLPSAATRAEKGADGLKSSFKELSASLAAITGVLRTIEQNTATMAQRMATATTATAGMERAVEYAAQRAEHLETATSGASAEVGKLGQQAQELKGELDTEAASADKAAEATDKFGKNADETSQRADKAERSTSAFAGALRLVLPILTAVTGALSIGALGRYADAWSDMQSRVGAAVKDMAAAPALMQRMVDLANASYSPLEQTVEVYARNVAVLNDLGVSAAGAADLTESLNHMLVITATRGERAASVQNALSKAMAVGRLQADGLETVLANGGRVAEALADELNTTVSGLRNMASQGKITGDVIADALLNSLEQVREEAAEMPATIQDAFVRIQTNFTSLVGRIDQATGASQNFASMLIGLADAMAGATDGFVDAATLIADNFDRLLFYAGGFATFMAGPYVASMIASGAATAGLTAALAALRIAIAGTGIGLLVLLISDVVYRIYDATVGVQDFGDALDEVSEPGRSLFQTLKIGAEAIYATFQWLAAGISAAMMGAFSTIYTAYADLVNGFNAGLRVFGIDQRDMDRNWAGGVAQDFANQRDQAFRQMTHKWGQLFGGGDMFLGTFEALGGASTFESVEDMWKSLGAGADEAARKIEVVTGKLNEYQQAVKAVKEGIQTLEQQALTFGLSETAATRFTTAMGLLRAAEEAKLPITSALIDEINGLANAYALAEEQARLLQQQQQLAISINNTLASGFANMFKGIIDGSKSAGEAISDLLGQLGQLLINQAFMTLFGGGTGGGVGGILAGIFSPVPGFAGGTPYAPGGLAWVGERGPELVNLPRGAQVYPHTQSMQMASGWNAAPQINIANTINVPAGTSADVAPAIAREVTKELRRQLPDAIEGYNRNPYRRHAG